MSTNLDSFSQVPKWYVAHTYTGYENKVKKNLERIIENRGLQDEILEIRIPVTKTETVKANGEVAIKETITIPGYVYINMIMNSKTWHAVRNISGCTGFVGPEGLPVALTDDEITSVGLIDASVFKRTEYSVGDTVRIKEGPMAGNTGIVSEVSDDKKKIKVLVSMFGRELPVELEADSVEMFGA